MFYDKGKLWGGNSNGTFGVGMKPREKKKEEYL